MVSRKFCILSEKIRRNSRFFDVVSIFKGLKSHDAETSGIKTWYENVRKLYDEQYKTLGGRWARTLWPFFSEKR